MPEYKINRIPYKRPDGTDKYSIPIPNTIATILRNDIRCVGYDIDDVTIFIQKDCIGWVANDSIEFKC